MKHLPNVKLRYIAVWVVTGVCLYIAFQIHHVNRANRTSCRGNLIRMDMMKRIYASEHATPDGFIIDDNELLRFSGDKPPPRCPSGGVYTLNPIGQTPTCSFREWNGAASHSLRD